MRKTAIRSAKETSGESSIRFEGLMVLAVSLLGILIYLPTLRNGYVLDDVFVVASNPPIDLPEVEHDGPKFQCSSQMNSRRYFEFAIGAHRIRVHSKIVLKVEQVHGLAILANATRRPRPWEPIPSEQRPPTDAPNRLRVGAE